MTRVDRRAQGIVRTGQRALNIDGRFAHREDWGMGVKAYIMDTGAYLRVPVRR